MNRFFVTIILFVGFLSGCTSTPLVRYQRILEPSQMIGMTDAFDLQRSEIEVALSAIPNGNSESAAFTVQSIPRDSQIKIGMRAQKNVLSSTKFNIVKQENTELVKTIGVETTDDTLKFISDVGPVIVKLIAMAAAPTDDDGSDKFSNCLKVGETLKLNSILNESFRDERTFSIDGKCVEVKIGPVPTNALELSRMPFNQETNMFIYSACRTADVSINLNNVKTSKIIKVSDPNYVQMVQLPYKGVVSMHSQCGVSVATEKTGSDTTAAAILSGLLVQAKAIDEARKAVDNAAARSPSAAVK